MGVRSVVDLVVKQRMRYLSRIYPESEITSDVEDGYHRIRVVRDGRPEHFDIVLEDINFKSRAIKDKIMALANTVSVTILFPIRRKNFDELYQANFVDISKGHITAIAYDERGVVMAIKVR